MVCEQLKLLRNSLNLSQKAMGEKLGIPQTTYANYENGKANIPDELKIALYNHLNLNLNWLITGNGEMRLDGTHIPESHILEQEPSTTFMTPQGRAYPMEIGDGGLSIPILASKVSAGPGQEWLPEDFRTDERLPILERFIRPYSIDKIFAAEVKGDSMTGIQLFDGDFVFAVKGYIDGDGVYVIAIGGETYVKRVEQDPVDKKLRIISENTRYQPRVVDVDQVVVLGKVIGWLHHHPY